jgi:Fe-S oxidoreductase
LRRRWRSYSHGGTFQRETVAIWKAEQIRATGASICITPCHNCYDQIRDLNKEYELGIKVLSFKEMFEEALIIPEELKAKDEEEDED